MDGRPPGSPMYAALSPINGLKKKKCIPEKDQRSWIYRLKPERYESISKLKNRAFIKTDQTAELWIRLPL